CGLLVDNGSITGSYYDSEKAGWDDKGKGKPRDTEDMTVSSDSDNYPSDTYEGWDFNKDEIWGKDHRENDGYPYLKDQ
ncbi:MAG: hypothetical protein ACOC4G_11655, partial [Bacillota bacterium]